MKQMLSKAVVLLVISTSGFALASEVTASRTLPVGSIVEMSDIDFDNVDGTALAKKFIGKEIKRAVYVGRVINPSDVGPVTIVKRNDVIRLHFEQNGLGIRTEARALESGGLGEEIPVMNIDTRVTVRAAITGKKRARVVR